MIYFNFREKFKNDRIQVFDVFALARKLPAM